MNTSRNVDLKPELCGNDCGKLVMMKNRKKHEKDECSQWIVGCCYCDGVLEHKLLSPHYTTSTCAEYPVTCPRRCGMPVARKSVKIHTSRKGDCRNRPVLCDFASARCQFVGKETICNIIWTRRLFIVSVWL